MVAGPGVELVLDAGARTAESPVWDPTIRQLRWVDIPAGSVHALDPSSGADTHFTVGGPVGGGLLLMVADGFATCTPDGGDLTRVATAGVPAGGAHERRRLRPDRASLGRLDAPAGTRPGGALPGDPRCHQ